MNTLTAISKPPERSPHRLRAVLASCVLHAVVLTALVVVLYRSVRPPLNSGSAAAVPTMTLSKLIIVASPLPPVPPVPPKRIPPEPVPPTPPAPPAVVKAAAPVKIPDAGVPVLAEQPKVEKKTEMKPRREHHVATSPPPSPPAGAPAPSTVASSHAPGENIFPHPPYPEEARFLRETGTVVVDVQFNGSGGVSQVQVTQSSGVPLLDAQTRSFIRANWHTLAYAGQVLKVPVEYTLEN
jgi:TonB family protein